jgi:hypothetical protein
MNPTSPFQVDEASPLTPKRKSMKKISTVRMSVVRNTSTVLSCNSAHVGQVTLFTSSLYDSSKYVLIPAILFCFSLQVAAGWLVCFSASAGGSEVCRHGHLDSNQDQRFWRPLFYH